jgi:hypothetical protein
MFRKYFLGKGEWVNEANTRFFGLQFFPRDSVGVNEDAKKEVRRWKNAFGSKTERGMPMHKCKFRKWLYKLSFTRLTLLFRTSRVPWFSSIRV